MSELDHKARVKEATRVFMAAAWDDENMSGDPVQTMVEDSLFVLYSTAYSVFKMLGDKRPDLLTNDFVEFVADQTGNSAREHVLAAAEAYHGYKSPKKPTH